MSEPVTARIPAMPGWRALFIEHDSDGNVVTLPEDPECSSVRAIDVTFWGLVAADPTGWTGALRFELGEPKPVVPLSATDERLDEPKGFVGYVYPGEQPEDALRRIFSPARQSVRKIFGLGPFPRLQFREGPSK